MAGPVGTRWVGAGTLPGYLGYWQVSVPLVVMMLSGQRLTLSVRPGLLSKLNGFESLNVEPADQALIRPVRSGRKDGIELKANGRQSYYFWPMAWRDDVMAALTRAGFQVSNEEVPYRQTRK